MAQKKRRSKKNKIKLAVVISLISLLGLIVVALVGGGAVMLSIYSQLDYKEIGDSSMNTDFMDAEVALQNGVPLDSILKDPNYQFTLEEVNLLTDRYMEWLQSLTGEADSDPNNTLDQWKNPPADEPLPPEAEKLINILCLGTDGRGSSTGGRTDTMIMITINTEKKTITMTSFLRDTYIKLAGTNRYGKLNAAYVYGGVGGVQDTLYEYFDLEFDNYAQVNFSSFADVVDVLGGIDMEMSDKEVANMVKNTKVEGLSEVFDPDKYRVEGTENTYHLNGKFALFYCRDRKANDEGQGDGDFGRTNRQRQVLAKLIEKAQSMSIGQLIDLIDVVLPMITTDLTIADCTKLLASVGSSYSSYKIQTHHMPAGGTYNYARENGQSVLSVDFEKNKKLLHALVFGE